VYSYKFFYGPQLSLPSRDSIYSEITSEYEKGICRTPPSKRAPFWNFIASMIISLFIPSEADIGRDKAHLPYRWLLSFIRLRPRPQWQLHGRATRQHDPAILGVAGLSDSRDKLAASDGIYGHELFRRSNHVWADAAGVGVAELGSSRHGFSTLDRHNPKRSPPGCDTFTSATFTTWKTTRPIARRVVTCSSSAIGTSLDATTLMSVAAAHSAMRDCQVASTKSPGSGDGDGCRFSSGVEEGSLRALRYKAMTSLMTSLMSKRSSIVSPP
jgi:hypothetical protein